MMNAKLISLTIVFAAIAIALNAVRIPTFFYPGNFFQFSQIPIIVAFLLFGARIGVLVGVLNLSGSIAILPIGSTGTVTYSMDFLSLLIMFAGLHIARKFIVQNDKLKKFSVKERAIICLTAFPTAFRGIIMPFIDYGVVFHVLLPLFFGVRFPEATIAALVPSFVLYNVTVSLYTVPLAYVLATRVGRYLKMESRLLG